MWLSGKGFCEELTRSLGQGIIKLKFIKNFKIPENIFK